MTVGVLIGIGITMALMLFLLFKLKRGGTGDNNNHFLLQLLILFFVIGGFILLAKGTLDVATPCSWNVVNSTSTAGVDYYNYEYQCADELNNTGEIFYTGTLWFARLFIMYIFLYFTYEVLKFLGWVVPKK